MTTFKVTFDANFVGIGGQAIVRTSFDARSFECLNLVDLMEG